MMKKVLLTLLSWMVVSGVTAQDQPVRVGIITDTHVTRDAASCRSLEAAMQLFKAHQVDLIINCGDVADVFNATAYANYLAVVRRVFPDNKPLELFAFAYHDILGAGNWTTGWDRAWPGFKRGLDIQHERYSKHCVGGYIFLTFQQKHDMVLYERMVAEACRETPDKPVFIIDHVPAYDTVYNSQNDGDVEVRNLLNKYPQVIQLSGHTHGTFRNELNIWQGEFTVINAGCASQRWTGKLIGTAPGGKRADEALLMEIYPDEIVIRRFDLVTGNEYKPDELWRFPLPFVPGTAPYRAELRQQEPAPEFPAGSEVTVLPNRQPFTSLRVTFPEAVSPDGTFIYRLSLYRRDNNGAWERFAVQETFGGFLRAPAARRSISHSFSSGFFESGREYRLVVEPFNFYGKAGRALEKVFTVPEKVVGTVVFESCDPMKDCPFLTGLSGGEPLVTADGFYLHNVAAARLVFPENVWAGAAGTQFRLTVDMHTVQPSDRRQWTLTLRHPQPIENACHRIMTMPGDSGCQRYVIDLRKRIDSLNFYLLIREGDPGKIRFEYVKIERF